MYRYIHGDIVEKIKDKVQPISQISNLLWEPQFYNMMPRVREWCIIIFCEYIIRLKSLFHQNFLSMILFFSFHNFTMIISLRLIS